MTKLSEKIKSRMRLTGEAARVPKSQLEEWRSDAEHLEGGGWIPVGERLPDYDVYVLWLKESGSMFIADIDHDNDWENFKETHERPWPDEQSYRDPITHWQPLPAAPAIEGTVTPK